MSKLVKLLLVSTIVIVYLRIFLPYPHVAGDLNYSYVDEIKDQFRLPQAWGIRGAEGMGENSIFVLWGWPLTFLYSFLSSIFGSYNITLTVFGYGLVVLLGFYSFHELISNLGIKRSGKLAAILLFLCNSYIILLLDGGQLAIALAYSLFPFALSKISRSIDGNLSNKIISGLIVVILGIFDIRYVYLLGILVFLYFIYFYNWKIKENFLNNILKLGFLGLIIISIFFLLNLYWILPLIYGGLPTLPEGYQASSQLEFLNFVKLNDSIALFQPHWYKNVFGQISNVPFYFLILPILVFVTPIIVKNKSQLRFWLIVAIIGIFLSKGGNLPLGYLYQWLFLYIPGFSLFRDSSKFFIFVILSYSILIGYLFDHLETVLPKINKIISVLFCALIVFVMHPVWAGFMTGTFSPPIYQSNYSKIVQQISQDNTFGRVIWVPGRTSLGYSSPLHTSIEAVRIYKNRPFVSGVVGGYETSNFLRESPIMGELFDVAGIKYIAYPYPDARRQDLKQDNIDYYYSFLDQLSKLNWIERNISEPPVAVLETKRNQDHFFLTNNTLAVVGSDDIYNDWSNITDFRLANNAIVFLEEIPGLGLRLKELPDPKLVLNSKTNTDLAVSLMNSLMPLIFPANKLAIDPNESGWWKRESNDFLWFRNFLQEKYGLDNQDFDYGGGYAIAEGNLELSIKIDQCTDCVLLARTMESSKSGEIVFYQGSNEIGKIVSKPSVLQLNPKTIRKLRGYKEIPDQYFEYDKANFLWNEVGRLVSRSELLTIKTKGDINVINALAVVPKSYWDQVYSDAYQRNSDSKLYWPSVKKLEDEKLVTIPSPGKVSYTRVSSTNYKVTITGLVKPSILAFSENYDSLWKIKPIDINGEIGSSIPLYSFINGFVVDKDGTYEVYFEPQKFVNYGLVISIASLIGIFLLLAILRFKESKV